MLGLILIQLFDTDSIAERQFRKKKKSKFSRLQKNIQSYPAWKELISAISLIFFLSFNSKE